MLRPTVGSGLVIAWAGMRGIVTLAAALALPAAFPFRDLIVLTAFSVVLGTLTLQGLTLKPLLRALDLRDDDPVGRELAAARARALRVGLASCDGNQSAAAEVVRQELKAHLAPPDTSAAAARRVAKPTETFTTPRCARRGRPSSACARTTRSATTRFIRWRKSWIGSRWQAAQTIANPKADR